MSNTNHEKGRQQSKNRMTIPEIMEKKGWPTYRAKGGWLL